MPVFIGLGANFAGKNRFFCLSNPFQVKTGFETAPKTAFSAVLGAHLRLKCNKYGRKQLRFI